MNKPSARRRAARGNPWLAFSAITRVGICVLIGLACSIVVGRDVSWELAPLVLWDVTASILLASLYLSLHRFDAAQTAEHALAQDPGRRVADFILILSSIASLVAVVVLLLQSSQTSGFSQDLLVGLGVVSIVISWTVIHIVYTLRYADLYFKGGKGIDFNGDESPTYADFAYVAFTVGMTYQVSDTNLKTKELRRAALFHALLSYLFGTAIIATALNFVVGLVK